MRSIRVIRAMVGVLGLFLLPALALGQKIGRLELEGKLHEQPGPLDWLVGGQPTLRSVIDTLSDAATDSDISAIVIRLKDAELNRTQVEELGTAMDDLREGGKKIYLFAENYGPTDLLLGAHADRIVIQAGGEVSFPGLHMEELFLADTLAWAGVKADLVQIGDFKGANEMFVNNAPSKAWDQNINQLLDSLYGNMRDELKQGRKLSDEQLDTAMKKVWMADADEAVECGLIDAAVDLPKLGEYITGKPEPEWTELDAGTDSKLKLDTSNPFSALPNLIKALSESPREKPSKPSLALLHIDGAIVDGDSSNGGLFGESGVGSRTIRNALEDIRSEDQIKGVVVRIDSPGGSAVASEVIWQGIKRVAEKKPVWVSVGSMAASGGYYIAVAGDKIYVNPSSIVGSIGVVGGKFAMGGLYDKVKVRVVERSRGPMADLESSIQPWSPEQIALVRTKMRHTYDLFTKRVSAGRKEIDLSKTAEGRLFTGNKSIEMKMADKVGGLDECVEDLAEDLKLRDYDVLDYPGPKSFQEMMQDLAENFGASAPGIRAPLGSAVLPEVAAFAREVIGPQAWPQVRDSLGAMMQLRKEPVVLAIPRALILK